MPVANPGSAARVRPVAPVIAEASTVATVASKAASSVNALSPVIVSDEAPIKAKVANCISS